MLIWTLVTASSVRSSSRELRVAMVAERRVDPMLGPAAVTFVELCGMHRQRGEDLTEAQEWEHWCNLPRRAALPRCAERDFENTGQFSGDPMYVPLPFDHPSEWSTAPVVGAEVAAGEQSERPPPNATVCSRTAARSSSAPSPSKSSVADGCSGMLRRSQSQRPMMNWRGTVSPMDATRGSESPA